VISRSARLAGVVAGVALGTTGCFRMTASPPIPASQNGRIAADALTTITPQCAIVTDKADQLQALLAAANADGVALAPEESSFLPPGVTGPPRIESCYRTYDMQVWWRNYYCSIGKCGNAAMPGTSKHGFGHAVDFQDQLGELTFMSPGYQWLTAYAALFGFAQPPSVQQGGANDEAWHWEAS
jgi:LAS superfamily LD-carboxypeptidase LdcB